MADILYDLMEEYKKRFGSGPMVFNWSEEKIISALRESLITGKPIEQPKLSPDIII